jgi:hypothetical protein
LFVIIEKTFPVSGWVNGYAVGVLSLSTGRRVPCCPDGARYALSAQEGRPGYRVKVRAASLGEIRDVHSSVAEERAVFG